jgi:hypothetical protein
MLSQIQFPAIVISFKVVQDLIPEVCFADLPVLYAGIGVAVGFIEHRVFKKDFNGFSL